MPDLDKLHQAVIDGDWKTAAAVTEAAIAAGVAPLSIVSGCLVPAMDEVGRRFECEDYFVRIQPGRRARLDRTGVR